MHRRYAFLLALLFALVAAPVSAQAPDIVQLPDQEDNDAGYNGDDLAQLDNGDILVVYVKNGVITNNRFPFVGPPAQLILTRSSDGGATWSPSDTLRTAIENGVQSIGGPSMAVLPSGRILLSYSYTTSHFPNFMAGEEAMYSDDNGATWTPYDVDDREIRIVRPTASGTLVATYYRERGDPDGNFDLWTATSTDEGVTWTNERFLRQLDFSICGSELYAASDTDWTFLSSDCFFGRGGTYTISRQRTTDGGATWSDPEALFTARSGFSSTPSLIVDANGRQSIFYGDDLAMAYRTSDDGGATWSDIVTWTEGTEATFDVGLTCEAGLNEPLCVFLSARGSTHQLLQFASIDALTTSDEGSADGPDAVALHPSAPNPTSGATRITFELARPADVTLALYDLLGRQVREIASGPRPAGPHTVTLDASDLPSGVYVVRLGADGQVAARRISVAR